MAIIEVYGAPSITVGDDELSIYCWELAVGVFRQWGIDPDEHEGAFDDFRYDVVEPAVLSTLEDAIESAFGGFPRDAAAWADDKPAVD